METDLALTLVLSTLALLFLLGGIVLLLVLVHNRRMLHRAELAEAARDREHAVIAAEREATQHTLQELGRELHDNLGQLLAVANLGLSSFRSQAPPDQQLSLAQDALVQAMDETRRLGHDLNSDLWQHRSLVDVISAEAERLERVARVRVLLLVNGTIPTLPADTNTILFRVFQVIITNALKHSGASQLEIELSAEPSFTIRIADNGKGFDKERTEVHAGLLNIHKRCALIGFAATCTTAPGGGCTWHLRSLPEHGT